MLKHRQKRALEKITGKPAEQWNTDAVRAYFAYTDRGITTEVPLEAILDFNELMLAHRQHSIIVEMWKQDFKQGLLFLDDFLRPDETYPENFIRHAFEVYKDVIGFIPSRYAEVAEARGLDTRQ